MAGMEMLDRRISLLENLIYGNNKPNRDSIDVKQRIDDLQIRVDTITNSIPTLKTSNEIITKIGPILFRQHFSIAQTEAKVINLLSLKNQLLDSVHQLTEISRLEPAVNKPFLEDIPKFIYQIQQLEEQISILQIKITKQSNELDEFLDIYQQSMEIIITEMERLEQIANCK